MKSKLEIIRKKLEDNKELYVGKEIINYHIPDEKGYDSYDDEYYNEHEGVEYPPHP